MHVSRAANQKRAKPFAYGNHAIEMSGSVGFVIFPTEGEALDDLMNLADKRMYQEKLNV